MNAWSNENEIDKSKKEDTDKMMDIDSLIHTKKITKRRILDIQTKFTIVPWFFFDSDLLQTAFSGVERPRIVPSGKDRYSDQKGLKNYRFLHEWATEHGKTLDNVLYGVYYSQTEFPVRRTVYTYHYLTLADLVKYLQGEHVEITTLERVVEKWMT